MNEERIDICDGKYTVILIDNGKRFQALRHGEEWRDLTGDGLVLAMFQRIQELTKENSRLEDELFGCQEDLHEKYY